MRRDEGITMKYNGTKEYILSIMKKSTKDIIILFSMILTAIYYYVFHDIVIVDELIIVISFWVLLKSFYEILVNKELENLVYIVIAIMLIYSNLKL